ncbi:MAG: TetR/AcrR family transcriptional regulator [Candidatus Riflebacteria bacterium]|nr:TetR/AcrR family transcriptional regulator [Candidatus Riflebacteria bacterium]
MKKTRPPETIRPRRAQPGKNPSQTGRPVPAGRALPTRRPTATARHPARPDPAAKPDRLLEMALDLFARQGFDNTTIDEIVDAAGFGKGTFYRYFPNKDRLLDRLLDDHFARLADAVVGAVTVDRPLPANLLAGIRAYVAVMRADRRLCQIIEELKVRRANDFLKRLHRACTPPYVLLCTAIQGEIKAGRFRPVKPDLFLTSLLGAVQLLVFREFKHGVPVPDADLKQVLSIMLNGATRHP